MIERLCIIGVGLIGGSLARALKRAGACGEVVGCGRDEASLQRAIELGVIDRYYTDPAAATKGADVVVLAVPLGMMEPVMRVIAPGVRESTVITDVGSAKASVVAAAEAAFGRVPARFVPGHPIAGTERSGVEASFAELFQGRRVILTPLATTDRAAHATIRAMWEQTGADVMDMEMKHHDEVLAATSHLPHVLAFALVDTLARMQEKAEIFRYAAGGFRDFTRIASSDPFMWRDICLANREAVVTMLDHFSADLAALRDAIARKDHEAIAELFARAKAARDRFCREERVE